MHAQEFDKRLAFNGISFTPPDGADLVALDARRLKLDLPDGSALDLQWKPLNGDVPLGKQVRKVAKAHKQGDYWELDPPAGLATPYEQHWFAWQQDDESGLGAVLGSPHTAAVARLVGAGRDVLAQVAGSLILHVPDNPLPWSVFGLVAQTPPHLALAKHSFQPGKYALELAHKAERLTLVRHAPAEVLLANADLESWTRQEFGKVIRRFNLRPAWENGHLWLRPAKQATAAARLAAKISKRPAWGALAAWQSGSSLLTVQAESIREPGWLQHVVESYGMVAPQ